MKFSVQKEALVAAVNQVLKAVSANSTLPILTSIKIVATAKGVELTGSDSDITIVSFIPNELDGDTLTEVQREGSILLKAKFFSEIIKKLPKEDVEIEVIEHIAHIKSGRSKFQLNGLDSEEYPRLPAFDEKSVITLKANDLKKIISDTVFSISTSESRPILTGIQWQVQSKVLICTATDSHRLARRELAINGVEESISVVIPGKSLSELNKVIDDSDEDVDVVFVNNQAIFYYRQLTFYSRLLEGNYPETSKLIPSSHKTSLVMNSKELSDAIDRASILSSDSKSKVVKMEINKGEMFIKLSSFQNEIGKVCEDVLAESFEGDDLIISFSAKFLKDALKVMKGNVEIKFTGAMRPFVLMEQGNSTLLQLLLPVRTY